MGPPPPPPPPPRSQASKRRDSAWLKLNQLLDKMMTTQLRKSSSGSIETTLVQLISTNSSSVLDGSADTTNTSQLMKMPKPSPNSGWNATRTLTENSPLTKSTLTPKTAKRNGEKPMASSQNRKTMFESLCFITLHIIICVLEFVNYNHLR